MAVRIDQCKLGDLAWSTGREDGWQLKLFYTHRCFMVLVSLRFGLEVDRGYLTSRQVRPLIDARQRILGKGLEDEGSASSRFLNLIALQEGTALKIYRSQTGRIGIQLVNFGFSARAVCIKGEADALEELVDTIRNRAWASPKYFG